MHTTEDLDRLALEFLAEALEGALVTQALGMASLLCCSIALC